MKRTLTALFICLTLITAKAQIAEKAEDICPLLIGESITNATVINGKNEKVKLMSVLEAKPTVLVFYRGGWCPYCNLQLSALGESEAEILEAGYQIIAISPESYENIKPTIDIDKIKYQVFADPDGKLLQQVGIAFKANEKTKGYIKQKTKGKVSDILPVPTVMILDTKGVILFEYINPDYKVRMSKDLLMAVLGALMKK